MRGRWFRAAVAAGLASAAVHVAAAEPEAAAASAVQPRDAIAIAIATVPAPAPAPAKTEATADTAPAGVSVFPEWRRPADLHRACDTTVADARRAQQRLATAPPGSDVLAALDDLAILLEDLAGPVALLPAVHPDAPLRDAALACEQRLQAFSVALLQDARVFRRLQRSEAGDAIDRRFRRDQLDAFEDAGVALDARGRARARAIARDLARLQQQFERRIREDRRRLAFTPDALDGVPPAVWADAPRDGRGRALLGLDAPTYQAVVTHATDRRTRERMWRAGLTQGGAANLRTLGRIAELRRQQAALMGFASYDAFVLRRRMAGDPQRVATFLDRVQAAVAPREGDDLAVLQARQPDTPLARWDVPFRLEQVRRDRFSVDQEAFRRHFPPQASLQFAFAVAHRLFGVRFEPEAAALWHPDASAFVVRDADGRRLGHLLVDLFPRDDKYNHAAVWSVRNVSTRTGRLPVAALVVNVNRRGLDLDELETLLHEFGHALHVVLSATRYASQGGTNVQVDFVEAPSQMFEDWVYDPAVVALFGAVCSACEPVPDGLLRRAWTAREFGKGLAVARQRLFATYDQALHGPRPVAPMPLWRRMESATPLGHVPGSQFPAGFAHIAGGYAGGYYGYLWSLALAEDMRTAFAGDRLSAATGARLRATVLSQGAQADGTDLLTRFLGRPPRPDAFFTALSRP